MRVSSSRRRYPPRWGCQRNYALHCGKPILRVNLDDVELTPGMELSLGGMQYVDATEPGGDYLERIVRTLLAERKEKA